MGRKHKSKGHSHKSKSGHEHSHSGSRHGHSHRHGSGHGSSRRSRHPSSSTIQNDIIKDNIEAGGPDEDTFDPQQVPEVVSAKKNAENLTVLANAKRLWLEIARNKGRLNKHGFEYNVFDSKKHRILTVLPVIDNSESSRETDKPKAFSVHSSLGGALFDFKYTTGNCFKRAIKIEVHINDEVVGTVQQNGKKLLILEASGEEAMTISGVPALGFCNQQGPDHFKSDIVVPSVDPKSAMGVIGRNGTIMDHVIVGEPSGFFFLEAQIGQIQGIHKMLTNLFEINRCSRIADPRIA